ncbi:MAG: hypothetical protein ACE5EN_05750 [Nitrospinota bacterium]
MPIYEYRHKEKPGNCSDPFEVIELAVKEPRKFCRKCKKPVERMVSSFSAHKNILSDSNLKEKGFTKWVPEGKDSIRKLV